MSSIKFLSLLTSSVVLFAGQAAALTIDFDTDGIGNPIISGQVIDDEYSSVGVTINTINYYPGPDAGVAFDTNNWTGDDSDLAWLPTHKGNYTGGSLGNIIVVQEDGVVVNGFISTEANDEFDRSPHNPTGVIEVRYSGLYDNFGFNAVDIEPDTAEWINLTFYNGASIIGQWTWADFLAADPTLEFGGNSINTFLPVSMANFNAAGFTGVDIELYGSGGFDNFTATEVPEPGTMALLGMALGGGLLRRKKEEVA